MTGALQRLRGPYEELARKVGVRPSTLAMCDVSTSATETEAIETIRRKVGARTLRLAIAAGSPLSAHTAILRKVAGLPQEDLETPAAPARAACPRPSPRPARQAKAPDFSIYGDDAEAVESAYRRALDDDGKPTEYDEGEERLESEVCRCGEARAVHERSIGASIIKGSTCRSFEGTGFSTDHIERLAAHPTVKRIVQTSEHKPAKIAATFARSFPADARAFLKSGSPAPQRSRSPAPSSIAAAKKSPNVLRIWRDHGEQKEGPFSLDTIAKLWIRAGAQGAA